MLNGQVIIDADAHIREPLDLLDVWLEPSLRERAPRLLPGGSGRVYGYGDEQLPMVAAEVKRTSDPNRPPSKYAEYEKMGFDSVSQLKAMDLFGVDMAFLYPTAGLYLWFFKTMDAEMGAGIVRAYNDWLHDFSQTDPKRLRPVAGLDLRDPQGAVEEARRVAKLGFRAVYVRPNPVNGRVLSSPDYEPLWAECEALDISVGVHEGSPSQLPATGFDRFETYFGRHATSHPMEQMMAFLTLVEGAVFERHPKLRFSFLESGSGWLPYWLWRCDGEYKTRKKTVGATIKLKPSEYFQRQCYIGCEPDEPYLPAVIDHIGEDRLLFASDYPHEDHGPEIMDELTELEGKISKQAFHKLIYDNPRAYYGLN